MQSRKLLDTLGVLGRGLRLRCPACGLGKLYDHGFHMRPTCPYCHVRFERAYGESLGGITINAMLTLGVSLGGFFLTDSLFPLPIMIELVFWIIFGIIFPALTYRATRGLWVSIAYLTGGVYADPDYERQYFAPQRRARRKQRTSNE
jgi:uncharacterized protein (DUF983 family)